MDQIVLARQVYRLLVYRFPAGLTRDELARELQVGDRAAREAVELAALLAAQANPPTIIGYDPQVGRYRAVGPDGDKAAAKRIILYLRAYLDSHMRRLRAYEQAYRRAWGDEPPVPDQERLF